MTENINSVKFSVLISIYKNEKPKYFREALHSVFAQNLQPTEVLLIKDGPLTKELDDIVDEYATNYPIFKIVCNDTNLGLGRALAKGITNCSYEYVVRMDTDDIIPPTRFEKEIAKLDEGYDVVSCWSIIYEDNTDNVIAVKKRPEHHEDIVKLAHKRSPICHAGCAYRKSSVLRAGNYEHHLYYEDYDLWIRMIMCGCRFYNIQEVLYYVRTSEELIKRRGGWTYMVNEVKTFKHFYEEGFYSIYDYIYNIATHSVIRLLPSGLRAYAMKRVWNYKSE